MMTKAKRDGGIVEISKWNLETLDNLTNILKDAMGAAVNEAVEISLQETAECMVSGTDPDKLMVWLPFGQYSGEYEGPQYNLSLSALIDGEIRYSDDRENMSKLRDHLRALAHKVDIAIQGLT